ncbi:putative suppressor of disruption of TFIIS protein [Entomophthora muscae]|uniref:Suppressor of disruption of TFIIS protein n=1 Tax=Entomophthora muscae TaxID=34485 RepID=A0ACC2UAM4_9FUNG|nr:putative suppressor of disruption of TFIIS protein [Entomophthora muscae]
MMTVSELRGIQGDLPLKTVAYDGTGEGLDPSPGDEKVFFFDIDNCLYDIETGISGMMTERIAAYGERIGIPKDKVVDLTLGYYKSYGLAVRGFIMHHDIDPNHYDLHVDQSLPLETILKPDLNIRKMLLRLNMKKWAFTNANRPHAEKVLMLLGIHDLFDGLTYCDYSQPGFSCKPELNAYYRAMGDANVKRPELCYFVDDSPKNLNAARQLGWNTIHVVGSKGTVPESLANDSHLVIRTIDELPNIIPSLFEKI